MARIRNLFYEMCAGDRFELFFSHQHGGLGVELFKQGASEPLDVSSHIIGPPAIGSVLVNGHRFMHVTLSAFSAGCVGLVFELVQALSVDGVDLKRYREPLQRGSTNPDDLPGEVHWPRDGLSLVYAVKRVHVNAPVGVPVDERCAAP